MEKKGEGSTLSHSIPWKGCLVWGCPPLIPAFKPNRRQKRADLCELEASRVYKTNSRTARATHPWKKPGADTVPSTDLYVQTGMHLPHKFGEGRRI